MGVYAYNLPLESWPPPLPEVSVISWPDVVHYAYCIVFIMHTYIHTWLWSIILSRVPPRAILLRILCKYSTSKPCDYSDLLWYFIILVFAFTYKKLMLKGWLSCWWIGGNCFIQILPRNRTSKKKKKKRKTKNGTRFMDEFGQICCPQNCHPRLPPSRMKYMCQSLGGDYTPLTENFAPILHPPHTYIPPTIIRSRPPCIHLSLQWRPKLPTPTHTYNLHPLCNLNLYILIHRQSQTFSLSESPT